MGTEEFKFQISKPRKILWLKGVSYIIHHVDPPTKQQYSSQVLTILILSRIVLKLSDLNYVRLDMKSLDIINFLRYVMVTKVLS